MAGLTIRSLDDAIKIRLWLEATSHGCSMEERLPARSSVVL